MPHLIRPNVTKVVTKDGEVTVNIAIELTLNLNADGIAVGSGGTTASPKQSVNDEGPDNWVIPDFKSAGKIKFGKDVKEQ